MSRRDELVEKMKAQLDQINRQIDDFEAKAEEVSSDARRKYEDRMGELRRMAKPVEDLLVRLRNEGEQQWDRFEAEAERTYKALVHSYNYFRSQMK